MNFDRIFKHILKNPQSYPGKQHQPNMNKLKQKELDSLAQFHLIIQEMIRNIHDNLLKGHSVFLKGLLNFLHFDIFNLHKNFGAVSYCFYFTIF